MKSRENKNEIEKNINVFFETLTFIIILYLISCFLISFHQNILKVLFSCVNISVMASYKARIEKYMGSVVAYLLLFASVILITFIIYTFGYFEVSNTITKF